MMHYIESTVLKQLVEEVGEENLTMLLSLFRNELRDQFALLNMQASMVTIEQISHSFKSSAESFGAKPLALLAMKFEHKAKEKDADWIDRHLHEYLTVISASLSDIETLLTDNELLNRLF